MALNSSEKSKRHYQSNPNARLRSFKWRKHNAEKRKVHNLVHREVRKGTIIVPSICSRCNESHKIEAHHEDYSKPFEIIWVCRKCHAALDGRTKRA